jgi:hypothetical protein
VRKHIDDAFGWIASVNVVGKVLLPATVI